MRIVLLSISMASLTSFLHFGYRVPETSVQPLGPKNLPVEVLIADELTLVREGLALPCDSVAGFRVVAQTGSARRALSEIRELKPAIALLDLDLSDLAVTDVIRNVCELALETSCAVLSVRRDRKTAVEALRAGACGYILRQSTAEQMADALTQLAAGGIYLSPQIEALSLFSDNSSKTLDDPIELLSSRQFQVYTLLVEGVRAKEIAARLGLSPKTVDTYKASLMRKLEVDSIAALVRFAERRNGSNARPNDHLA